MKLLLLIAICLSTLQTIGQEIRFTSGELAEQPITKIPAAESISDEAFEVAAHMACTDEKQQEMWNDMNGPQTVVTINGQVLKTEGFTELEFLYSFQAEEGESYLMKPSVRIDIPLEDLLYNCGKCAKASGNKLTIKVSFNDETLASGELTFDIPDYRDVSGDFCDLRPNYISGEQDVLNAISKAFTADFPSAQLKKAWLPSSWLENEDGSMETTGRTLFSDNGDFATVTYQVLKKDGSVEVKVEMDRLRSQLNPDCVAAFLTGE